MFFLKKYQEHILPVADTYAFCLLPNRFHFLIKIKSIDVIEKYYLQKKKNKTFTSEAAPEFIMERFQIC